MSETNGIKVGLIVTSASHFPVNKAEESMDKIANVFPLPKKNLVGPYLIITLEDAERAIKRFKAEVIDALVIVEGAFTWDNIPALIVQELGNLPLVMWALPEPPMMEGGELSTNSLCGAIMNCAALKKLGRKFKFVYGAPKDEKVLNSLKHYFKGVSVVKKLHHSKYCLVGYRPTGFYNSTFDELSVRRLFGIETIHLSLVDLLEYALNISDEKVKEEVDKIKKKWKIGEATQKDLYNSVKFYKFLLDFSHKNKIDCYGIKCWPEFFKRGLSVCFVLSWLINEGIMAGCEADFDGTITMLLEYYLSGKTPWLADLVNINKKKNTAIFWHCGSAPSSLAYDKSEIIIQKQFRGSARGASIEFPLKTGRVTVARLGITQGKYRMFITTGEALPTKMILRGNPSIVKMDVSVERLLEVIIENGVEHHFAIVYGDHKDDLIGVSELLNIKTITVE